MMNITASEAAKRLDVSIQTIYRHIRAGKLKGFQKDGKWYVQLDEQEINISEHSDEHIEHPAIGLLKDENKHLRELLERRDEQIDHLTQVVAMSQKNVASLTERLDTSRAVIEDLRRRPWWKRLFLKV